MTPLSVSGSMVRSPSLSTASISISILMLSHSPVIPSSSSPSLIVPCLSCPIRVIPPGALILYQLTPFGHQIVFLQIPATPSIPGGIPMMCFPIFIQKDKDSLKGHPTTLPAVGTSGIMFIGIASITSKHHLNRFIPPILAKSPIRLCRQHPQSHIHHGPLHGDIHRNCSYFRSGIRTLW